MIEKLRYAIYTRKSTEEEERQVLSLSSQRDKIRECFGDLEIVAEFSESKSAFEPDKRIKFKELLDLIDAGQVDGIIAWHPDRLSRNEVDASSITWRVRQGKIKDLKFASFSFDNSADGLMMLQMTMSQSQYFSAKLSKDVKRGNEKKRQMGGLTGRAPEGYLNHRTSTVGRGEAIVIKDPDRFDLVRKAFDLFLTGDYSLQSIHTVMTKEWGYKTMKRSKSGGEPISKANIYKIFRNVRYAGLVPDPYNPERFYKASYPAMITMDEYDQVQTLLGRDGMPRLVTRKQFALRGLIHCADCGCTITAQSKRKKLKSGKVNIHTYYHCTGRRDGCSQKSIYIRENDLYDQLNSLLDQYELSPKMYEWAMGAFQDFADKEVEERNGIQAMQTKSISDTQAQLDRLLDMATRGLIDDEQYRIKGTELKSQLKLLQEEQSDTAHRVKNWYEMATETLATLTGVTEAFSDGDLADKKSILLAIGQNPTLLDGKLLITPNEWLLPVAVSAKSIRSELEAVRTMPQQIQKTSEEALSLSWCSFTAAL